MSNAYLKPYAVTNFLANSVVTDKGSGASDDLSLWLPDMSKFPKNETYYYLGMFATNNYNNTPVPPGPQFVYRAINDDPNNPLLVRPVGFNLIWSCIGNDQASNLGIYSIVPPAGYVGIGCVAVMDFNNPPQLSDFPDLMCVRVDQVTTTSLGSNCVWNDQNSGAPTDVAVWILPYSNTAYATLIPGYDNIAANTSDVALSNICALAGK